MLGDPDSVDLELHDAVRRRLKARNVRLIDVAVATGRQPSLVTLVSQGYRRDPVIEAEISKRLDETPESLWPARFRDKAREAKP